MSGSAGLFDIRPEERRNTWAAFATLFGVTAGHTLLETARDTLFLAKLPATQLPWMYLAIVALALVLAQLGQRVRSAETRVGISLSLGFAALVTAGFWTLGEAPTTPMLYALYVWSGLFASFATVAFWTLLGRLHTVTQAKRLYGPIGAGAVLGAIAGALGARATIEQTSPRAVLLLAAVVFALSAAPCLLLSSGEDEGDGTLATEPAPGTRGAMSLGLTLLWRDAFARRVLGIVLLSTVTVTLGDYLFKSVIAAHAPDARALGAKLSGFYAVTNSLALVAQLGVAPWLFRNLGVSRALFLFPLLLIGAALGVVGTGGAPLAAMALKGVDGSLRHSVHRTSTELLLVPVPDGTRERIKPIVDLLGMRGGQALASAFVLVLAAASAADPVTVGALVLALAVVWAGVVVTVRGLYLDVFRETLRAGGLSGKVKLPELDLGALEAIFAGLGSSRDGEVLGALELLADLHKERLVPALILYHPSREVVLRALEVFTRTGRTDFVSIADRLADHPDREVAAAALRARVAVEPDRDLLLARLDEGGPELSATALVALRLRGLVEDAVAAERLDALLREHPRSVVLEVARTIRDLGGTNVEPWVDELLVRVAAVARAGQDTAGMREVARAMGARHHPRFLKHLMDLLDRHDLRAELRSAIEQIPGALDALDIAMSSAETRRDVRLHLPRTVAGFDPARAAAILLRHLPAEKDGAVRFKILRGLVRVRARDPRLVLDPEILTQAAEETLAHAFELRAWSRALQAGLSATIPGSAAHHLLVDLLRDKEMHATERLFMLLGLLYAEDFDDALRGLGGEDARRRAGSLELLDNVLTGSLRAEVMRLVGGADVAADPPSGPPVTYGEALGQMLARGGRTVRTLAEYRAAELDLALGEATGPAPSSRADLDSIGARLSERAREMIGRGEGRPTRAPA